MQDGDISNVIAPAIMINIVDTVISRVMGDDQKLGLIDRIRVALKDFRVEASKWYIDTLAMSALDRIIVNYEYRVILCTVGMERGLHETIEKMFQEHELSFTKMKRFENILDVREYVSKTHRHVVAYFDVSGDNAVVVNGTVGKLFEGWQSVIDEL